MHISFLLAIDDDEGSFGSPGLIFPAKLSFWSKKNSKNFHVLIKLLIQPLLHDDDYGDNIDVLIHDHDHYDDIDDDDDDSPLCAAPPALRATQEPVNLVKTKEENDFHGDGSGYNDDSDIKDGKNNGYNQYKDNPKQEDRKRLDDGNKKDDNN